MQNMVVIAYLVIPTFFLCVCVCFKASTLQHFELIWQTGMNVPSNQINIIVIIPIIIFSFLSSLVLFVLVIVIIDFHQVPGHEF